jgi:hypothetical protein
MTNEEFERLKRRFGADVSAWPAPYRQEGLRLLAGEGEADRDEALDRLILDASSAETDEVALTRKVLSAINDERQPVNPFLEFRRMWFMPMAVASGFAALLLVAVAAGYVTAGSGLDATDDSLMALALGGGGLGNGEIVDGLLDDIGAEEQL